MRGCLAGRESDVKVAGRGRFEHQQTFEDTNGGLVSEDRATVHWREGGTECRQVDPYGIVAEAREFELEKVVKENRNGYGVQRVMVAMSPGGESFPFCLIAGPGRQPPDVRGDLTHWGGACPGYA